jgi:hypothetical protein
MTQPKRCKECDKVVHSKNESGFCYVCYRRNYYQSKKNAKKNN